MTIETTQKIPLTLWKDGSIRIKGTRLLIDSIIRAHKSGETPEGIFESFPSNVYTVADIYSVIAYYLTHKEDLERYLAKREKEADGIREQIESVPDYAEKRDELRKKLRNRWEQHK